MRGRAACTDLSADSGRAAPRRDAGADVEGVVAACRRSDVCIFFVGTTMLDGDVQVGGTEVTIVGLFC